MLYVDPVFSDLALYLFRRGYNVIVAIYNNDIVNNAHVPLLTLSHKESNLEALDVEAVDIQTL